MKNLRNWTMEDVRKALECVMYERGGDYKDHVVAQYDAMYDYAEINGISMDEVPDAYNCPRSFWAWTPKS